MASRKESASLKVIAKKKGKTNKKLTWTDQDTDVFAEVISDPLYRGSDYTVACMSNALLDVFVNNCNATSAAILVLTSTQASTRLLKPETPVV